MIDTQDATLAGLTHALVERFAPERIVLFGSRARGDHHAESDYDLMLVLGESLYSTDVVRRAVQDLRVDADVIVDSLERFERRRSDVGTLEYVADLEGRVLYTRVAAPERRRVRETPSASRESLAEWSGRAHSDFTMMETGLRHAPDARDSIVFHAHQSVEKMLKAVLVARRVAPPRTHDLTALSAKLPDEFRGNAQLDDACRGLQGLWPNSRYPHEPVPTDEQVDQAARWARIVREIVGVVIAV